MVLSIRGFPHGVLQTVLSKGNHRRGSGQELSGRGGERSVDTNEVCHESLKSVSVHYIYSISVLLSVENSDITQALSKLTEPTAVPIHKLSVSNMVHSARKRIRRHRRLEESPLNNDVLNSILLVRTHTHTHNRHTSVNIKSMLVVLVRKERFYSQC